MRMKSYANFDLWQADRSAAHQRLAKSLRRFVKVTAPSLEESVKWGNGVWLRNERPVLYLYADKDHLQFGFFAGAKLTDPKGLLIGKGQYVRHIKIRSPKDIDRPRLGRWIRQAVRNSKA